MSLRNFLKGGAMEGEQFLALAQRRGSGNDNKIFLDASTHLYKRLCPSVGPSFHPSVRPSSVDNHFFSNSESG